MSPEEFFDEITQGILARSGAEEEFTRTTFIEFMCSKLEDEGYVSGFTLTEHKISARGQAVDAWSFDDELSKLTLFIADFRAAGKLETLSNAQVSTHFRRLRNFVEAASNAKFAAALEEADPTASLAWFLAEHESEIEVLSLVLISNAQLSAKVAELPTDQVRGTQTIYEVWDFGRLYRTEMSGKSREDLEISFTQMPSGGVPCLPAHTGGSSFKSYLLVLPGKILADLYQTYGERLLEQNVRTFLQFRGKINKGIRNTIINEPDMFFAYNNGLSATAESVSTTGDDSILTSVTNLQIVNGGQTTASIFTAGKKDAAALEQVYVQVKLSVIERTKVEEVVPRISEYSNTQNRVNAADFFSNHPFHLRMEEFSRRLWARSPGSVKQTHWFYERARGQYANLQANLTPSEKKSFLLNNPRNQMFTKTDLAKFILTFDEAPDEVSLGAQKAFSGSPRTQGLVGRISKQWEKDSKIFNEHWFKCAIAKAIFFRELDSYVFRQPWYAGYKANIVTYSLAKFVSMIGSTGCDIDFLSIWEAQSLPPSLLSHLGQIAETVNEMLTNPPAGVTANVSEWAKKNDCWERVKNRDIVLSSEISKQLIDFEKTSEQEKDGSRVQEIQDGIHAQTYVVEKGSSYWAQLQEWNDVCNKLTAKEIGILQVACAIPRKIPTEKQAGILRSAEVRAKGEGFFPTE